MIAEVYVDLYFLINTCMNLLCIMITASLLHRSVSRLRALLSSAFGAAYAVIALLFSLGGVLGTVLDFAVAFVMCLLTFAQKPLRLLGIVKCTAVQMLTSMLLGGIMTALYTLLNRLDLPFEALKGDNISVWSFAILSAVAGIATAHGGRFFGISKKTRSVTIHATIGRKTVTLHALVDSGNLLRDPISGRYVIVANKSVLSHIVPKETMEALVSPFASDASHLTFEGIHIRLIPTKTACGQALLPAFLPDRLTVTEGKETYAADYLIAAADLGESAHGFDAIIPFE